LSLFVRCVENIERLTVVTDCVENNVAFQRAVHLLRESSASYLLVCVADLLQLLRNV